MTRIVFLAATLLMIAAPPPAVRSAPKIVGNLKVEEHGLVRLTADGVDAKSALFWQVTPKKHVSRATNPRGTLEFAAPPGTYDVALLVFTSATDGGLSIEEATVTVEIAGKTPPPPPPPPPPGPKPDALAALCQLRVGNSGCTATVVYPRRKDGRWDVLTAAHCTGGVGSKGQITLKDGRMFTVTVTARDQQSDCTWYVTDNATVSDMPYAVLSTKLPVRGERVWHSGYGVDKPRNREDGECITGQNSGGQSNYHLSVSPGDSGGGVFRHADNELLSSVCCTEILAGKAPMWGCSPVVAASLRPKEIDPALLKKEVGEPDRLVPGIEPLLRFIAPKEMPPPRHGKGKEMGKEKGAEKEKHRAPEKLDQRPKQAG